MKHFNYYHFWVVSFLLNHSEHDIFIHNFRWMFVISQFRKRCRWAGMNWCPSVNMVMLYSFVRIFISKKSSYLLKI